MSAPATISRDVVARYAADAARDVPGVSRLVASRLHRHDGVRVSGDGDTLGVEVHLGVEAGAVIPSVGAEVQARVAEYLERMTGQAPAKVDVVVQSTGG